MSLIDTYDRRFAARLVVACRSWSIVVGLWVSQGCSILIIAVGCRSCIVIVGCLGGRSISCVSLSRGSISGIGLRWASWSSETIRFTFLALRHCIVSVSHTTNSHYCYLVHFVDQS